MKIEQEDTGFKPITITLETKEEMEQMWDICEKFHQELPFKSKRRQMLIDISNYFTNYGFTDPEIDCKGLDSGEETPSSLVELADALSELSDTLGYVVVEKFINKTLKKEFNCSFNEMDDLDKIEMVMALEAYYDIDLGDLDTKPYTKEELINSVCKALEDK